MDNTDNKEVEKLEKGEKSKHGGYRPGSGRKPLLDKEHLAEVKELIAQHGSEVDPLRKQARTLVLMDKLYELGVSSNNIPAIKEYLDRQLGKSKESIDHTTGGERIVPIINVLPPKSE